ncbi:MAG: 2-oxoisovalerate dehydrogenase [Thermus sp.]|uniref:2-oxoisovalerate dehydrogenase n=1 Tax=Thermus TaxID=270 RepID=UPI001FA95024|nr:2-oxoisovalerate dehydrogenase [Thermus neutrinimicus]
MPKELIFPVEEAEDGGYVARALGEAILTQGEAWGELRERVRDAVRCHYPEGEAPGGIRSHFVREEVLAP